MAKHWNQSASTGVGRAKENYALFRLSAKKDNTYVAQVGRLSTDSPYTRNTSAAIGFFSGWGLLFLVFLITK